MYQIGHLLGSNGFENSNEARESVKRRLIIRVPALCDLLRHQQNARQ
jgi:hypothetical protein